MMTATPGSKPTPAGVSISLCFPLAASAPQTFRSLSEIREPFRGISDKAALSLPPAQPLPVVAH